jgi:hypothetical protein
LAKAVFNIRFIVLAALGHHDFSLAFFVHLHLGKALLLVNDLILHLVFSLDFELLVATLLLVLLLDYFCLLGFFFFR